MFPHFLSWFCSSPPINYFQQDMQNDLSKRDAKNASIAFLLTQSTSQGPYCTANLQVSLPDFANKYTECRVYDSENVHWASAKLTFLLFFCACSTRVSTAWDGGGCQSRDLGWGACSGVSLSERSFLTSTYHHLSNEKKKSEYLPPLKYIAPIRQRTCVLIATPLKT